jgi:hypothetical protein
MIIKLPNPLYAVTFDKTAKTVTIANLGSMDSAIINRVVNVTDGVEIFGAVAGKGAVVKSITPDEVVVNLVYDTSAMDDADVLEVSVDVSSDEVLFDAISHITAGGGGGGGGGAITSVDLGVRADPNALSDTATASLISLTKRGLIKDQSRNDTLVAIDTKTPALVSGRVPVEVLASVVPTGAATETTLGAVNGKLPALSSGRVPVVLPDTVVLGKMRGPISDSFARPADTSAYLAGDAIQNATSSPAIRRFQNLLPAGGGSGYISIAAVVRNAAMTARLRIHLFATDPGTKAVDNAAFSVATTDEGAYLGYIDLDAFARGVACSSNRKEVVVAGADLFYQIETLDAFTPASGTNYLLKATLDANI